MSKRIAIGGRRLLMLEFMCLTSVSQMYTTWGGMGGDGGNTVLVFVEWPWTTR